MSKFKHVDTWIFDMDYVLYPPETGMLDQVYDKFGVFMANKLDWPFDRAMAQHKVYKDEYGDAFIGWSKHLGVDVNAEWQKHSMTLLDFSVLKRCEQTLHNLESLEGRKIIFTNGPCEYANRVLKEIGLDNVFEAISTVTNRGIKRKPEQNAYDHLLNTFGLTPKSCIFVEDTEKNLKPAKEMGMTTVLINVPNVDEAYIDYHYATLLDFLHDIKC